MFRVQEVVSSNLTAPTIFLAGCIRIDEIDLSSEEVVINLRAVRTKRE